MVCAGGRPIQNGIKFVDAAYRTSTVESMKNKALEIARAWRFSVRDLFVGMTLIGICLQVRDFSGEDHEYVLFKIYADQAHR